MPSQLYVRTRVGKAYAEGAARKDPGTAALAGRTGTCPNLRKPGIPGEGKGLIKRLTSKWDHIHILYGEMPGDMYNHQFFTHGHQVFNMGGKVNY